MTKAARGIGGDVYNNTIALAVDPSRGAEKRKQEDCRKVRGKRAGAEWHVRAVQ